MVQRDIVVIGASAGGVQVLKTVVSGLPSGFPAAVLEERILLLRKMEQLAREKRSRRRAKECAEQANQEEQGCSGSGGLSWTRTCSGLTRTFSNAHCSKLNLT